MTSKFDERRSNVKSTSTGAIIFDMSAGGLSSVAEKIADELLNKDEIRASDREGLLRALLMRRR